MTKFKKDVFSRLAIRFSPSSLPMDAMIDDSVVGFIHGVLGKGNKWHDAFSPYCVSSMCGGSITDDGRYDFKDGGIVYVSSFADDFITDLVGGLMRRREWDVCGMEYIGFECVSHVIRSDYDIVKTLSPIMMKERTDDGCRYLTVDDGDAFFERLNSHSRRKLMKAGFDKDKLDGFVIEPFHIECACVKVSRHKGYSLPCSKLMMVVKGDPVCRRALYEMGIGSSTGYCHGAIEIKDINDKKTLLKA